MIKAKNSPNMRKETKSSKHGLPGKINLCRNMLRHILIIQKKIIKTKNINT